MAKVKNKKKAFKHRLKKQGLFNNLKALFHQFRQYHQ